MALSAEEGEQHPVLAALEQAILDLLEEFDEGHGPLDERDAEVFEAAKARMHEAVRLLREG